MKLMRLTGDLIRMVRISRKFTQAALAKKIGVTQPLISYLEGGIKQLTIEMELRIREALNLDDMAIRKLSNNLTRRRDKKDDEWQ